MGLDHCLQQVDRWRLTQLCLFGDNKALLWLWHDQIVKRLAQLRLTIHGAKGQVDPVKDGIPWLGFRVFPTHRRLKRRNLIQFRQRLEHNITQYRAGSMSFAELDASVKGWVNHVRYADTWGLRNKMLWGQSF